MVKPKKIHNCNLFSKRNWCLRLLGQTYSLRKTIFSKRGFCCFVCAKRWILSSWSCYYKRGEEVGWRDWEWGETWKSLVIIGRRLYTTLYNIGYHPFTANHWKICKDPTIQSSVILCPIPRSYCSLISIHLGNSALKNHHYGTWQDAFADVDGLYGLGTGERLIYSPASFPYPTRVSIPFCDCESFGWHCCLCNQDSKNKSDWFQWIEKSTLGLDDS